MEPEKIEILKMNLLKYIDDYPIINADGRRNKKIEKKIVVITTFHNRVSASANIHTAFKIP